VILGSAELWTRTGLGALAVARLFISSWQTWRQRCAGQTVSDDICRRVSNGDLEGTRFVLDHGTTPSGGMLARRL